MKAVVLDAYGDASNFRLADVPKPGPRPGQVLIRVAAASINPVDTKLRANGPAIAPELPAVLGCDVAGVIEAVGEGVAGFAPGDEVYGCAGGLRGLDGSYAEYMNADPRLLALKPATLSMREAAALPLVSITAWEGLFDRARIEPGETVLVHGGAGGVGHVSVQLAAVRGARVVATVSTAEKAGIARDLGAHDTVLYRDEPMPDYVARLTAGRGFDVVFDATGGTGLAASFEAARPNGRVVTIVSRFSCDLSGMHARGLSLHVVFMLIPMIHGTGREHHGEILRRVSNLVDTGRLRPLLDGRRFTLAEVADAHRHLEDGGAVGKVVIDVAAA